MPSNPLNRYRLLRSGASLALLSLLVLSAIPARAQAPTRSDDIAKRVAPCMTCHGKEGRATNDGYYPRIAGKPAGYLYNQLINFRDGRRQQYPLMVYMVQNLSDDYLKEMAGFFADQHLPYPPPPAVAVTPAILERGRQLVLNGDPSRKIPACVACHGEALTGVAPAIPGLLGLPRDYINSQFGAWREGTRRAHAPDCMAEISRQLRPDEISAASAWLSTREVPADAAPARSLPAKLPVACGSVAQ